MSLTFFPETCSQLPKSEKNTANCEESKRAIEDSY